MSAKRWSVSTLSAEHQRIGLDANVLIYVLEGLSPLGELSRALIDAAGTGRITAGMSALAKTEVLVGFARTGDARRFELAADEIGDLGIAVLPIDAEIAEDAAWLRADPSVSLADAIHLATARAFGATAFVTNDRRIRPLPNLAVYQLADMMA